ncbi:prephenate dehydrogenase [Arcobacter sp. 15-2]|uniref:prephenate dehydrogenase n=1 Tax=Arcobacter sp. 15-2 TaxID=3374109 RepID=UPI00399C85C3
MNNKIEQLKFGIVGLGLMGGSFAKVVKKYNLSSSVVGYDHNKEHQKQALVLNLVERIVELDELLQCDVIVLCIPVDAIIKFMPTLEGISANTTIMDFGSTKKLIVDNIPKSIRKNFIAAHPMTGTEKFGPSAAIDGLYEGKTVVLCDLDICDNLHKERVLNIFNAIAMRIVEMDSTTHDKHACYISHLPHAISYGLANTVMSHEDPENIITLAAGGFRDMSRIAQSSSHMWTDIFRQNRENLLKSLDLYAAQMQDMQKMLQDEDYESLSIWMDKANSLHDIL